MTAAIRPIRDTLVPRARPLPVKASDQAIRAAYNNGLDDGERAAYPKGWRSGFGYGWVYGMLAGAGLLYLALQLGLLVGAE